MRVIIASQIFWRLSAKTAFFGYSLHFFQEAMITAMDEMSVMGAIDEMEMIE